MQEVQVKYFVFLRDFTLSLQLKSTENFSFLNLCRETLLS